MRKTNLNIKRVNFFKKLSLFLIVQIIIVILFVLLINTSSPVNENALNKKIISIDKIEYHYVFMSGSHLSFYSEKEKYSFPKFPVLGTNEYSIPDLHDNIAVGDTVYVEYIKDGDSNIVIELHKGESFLRTSNGYNNFQRTQRPLCIIAFSIIEAFFLSALAFFILLYGKEIKLFQKRKHKNEAS